MHAGFRSPFKPLNLQLEVDCKNLLSQFEDELPEKQETYSEGVTMFLERLGADKTGEGLEQGLEEKVGFTNGVVSKMIELIDQSRQIWKANAQLFESKGTIHHLTNYCYVLLQNSIPAYNAIMIIIGSLNSSTDCDLEEIVREENGQMRQEIDRLQNKFLQLMEKERSASSKLSGM